MDCSRQKTKLLRELLKEDQEPLFHLSEHIPQKRSFKRRAAASSNLCRHACFFTLHGGGGAGDATNSPFPDQLRSPAILIKSPPDSRNGAVFLDIPSRIAAVLLESSLKTQKPNRKAKPTSSSHDGFGLFGSFLKKLKGRSNKKLDLKTSTSRRDERSVETAPFRLSSVDRAESRCVDNTPLDLGAPPSTSGGYGSDEEGDVNNTSPPNSDLHFPETRYCMSPFVFSLRRSTSSSAVCTPEFCSPVGSPSRHVMIKENASNNEEQEQCSPVSVLDPPLDENGDEKKETEEEDDNDDYDLESSYANVQRAKEQLLRRLGRFERLAELDPIELERLVEGSDDDYHVVASSNRSSNLPRHHLHSSTDHHRPKKLLVSDEEKFSNRSDHERELGFAVVMEFDSEGGSVRWTEFGDEVEETARELDVLILDSLMEELI